jgi:ribose transport system substrate-binding protein
VEAGVAAGAVDRDVDVTMLSPDDVDEHRQLAYFDTAIREDFDGIVTMALNPESFTPAINRATRAGVPVVLLDGDAPNSTRIGFFGSNNYQAGLMVAQLIDELVDTDVRLGVVTAGITLRHITDRLDGIQTYFVDRDDLRLVRIEDSRADETLAYEKARLIMDESNANVIFAAGAVDSWGVARALEELETAASSLIGIGFDDTAETLDYVQRGVLSACIAQAPYQMGIQSTRALVDFIRGEAEAPGVRYTPVAVVSRDNLDTYKESLNDDQEALVRDRYFVGTRDGSALADRGRVGEEPIRHE